MSNRSVCATQQMEPVKGGIDSIAMAVSLQSDLLIALLDKSLPTMVGLAGEALEMQGCRGVTQSSVQGLH